jgi:hypothetical protein
MTTNMQTQLCGSIPCFRPGPAVKTATPQWQCGAAEPAWKAAGKYDGEDEDQNETEDGLTQEDLMDVLTLYLL